MESEPLERATRSRSASSLSRTVRVTVSFFFYVRDDVFGKATGISVCLVGIKATVQLSTLFGRERERILIRGDAVPQVLDQADTLVQGQFTEIVIHVRRHMPQPSVLEDCVDALQIPPRTLRACGEG